MNANTIRALWPKGIPVTDYERLVNGFAAYYGGTTQEAQAVSPRPTRRRNARRTRTTPAATPTPTKGSQPERILSVIGSNAGGITVRGIAKHLGLPSKNVSSLLSKMKSRGVLTARKAEGQTYWAVKNGTASEAIAH